MPPMRLAILGAVAALLLASGAAVADGGDLPATRAHAAYDRGTAAYARGDFLAAARAYAEADSLVATAVALQAALDAAIRADEPTIAMELVERSARAPVQGELAELTKTARTRFAGRTGRIRLVCGAPPCVLSVDSVPSDAAKSPFVTVGPHTVMVRSAIGEESHLVDVHGGETVTIATRELSTPPPPPPPPPRSSPIVSTYEPAGVSPAWFFASAGVTAALAGMTIWSGIDTANRHDTFTRSCSSGGPACTGLATDGASAQTRTNALLGVTAALAVGSTALGLFVVRWRSEPRAILSAGLVHGAPAAALLIPFR